MANANTLIYDKSVDRAAMLRLYEKRITGKTELIFKGHHIRVDKLVREARLRGGFKAFEAALDAEIKGTIRDVYNSSARSMLDLFKSQVDHTSGAISSAVGKIWEVNRPPRVVAEEIVLRKPLYSDQTLSQGWSHLGEVERRRIVQQIRSGIAEGLDENQIASSLKKTFKLTQSQASGLAVTAMTSVYVQADHQVYLANKAALTGWQYVAVLDSRTTPLCAHRDGTIYPVGDTEHLPPAHWHCRSSTIPIVKSYEDLSKLEGVGQIRKRNIASLSPKQIAFYDGQSPLKESYSEWLARQPKDVQIRHLGDTKAADAFSSGQLAVDGFTNSDGRSIGIRELNRIADSGYGAPGDTRRFANAKLKLDTLKLGAVRPDDFYTDTSLVNALREYYKLQAGELDGTLSLTNYRGTLLHNKKATKNRVLTSAPTEDNLKFNPLTGRYDDARMYQPTPSVLSNAYRLVDESAELLPRDKEFIKGFVDKLEGDMGVNERAVVAENLRNTFKRFRDNKEPWGNLKAVLQGQVKFDVMNVSDFIETQVRRDSNLLAKLKQANYIDPVLGPVQLQDLHDNFIDNIKSKNTWESRVAPRIAKELRGILDLKIPVNLRRRLSDTDLDTFYLKFANRLSLADSPDRDQLAVSLGRDLYNSANYRGSRSEWYRLGVRLLDDAKDKGFYELETFGVQKRRMRGRAAGNYFGPYYDTFAVNLRIVDPRIQEYAKLTRKVDVGLRVSVTEPRNRLYIREGYKTYFIDDGALGFYDTRIPITSTDSFANFPESLIDAQMVDALNWTASAQYKIDPEFHAFVRKLLTFQDDKGRAEYYHNLNKYKEFMVERGDAYERLKAMEWLVAKDKAFSNHPFLDHRARIYERGFIGPQSGETYRPFLNTVQSYPLGEVGYYNLQDQIGSFLGGLSDTLEGNYNALSVKGRQQVALKWRKDLVEIGDSISRGLPGDIRKILESPLVAEVDGEEQGKLFRLALEMSRINKFLGGDFSAVSVRRMSGYNTVLALEQDASSSGAQIIALTTRNKELAALSNVVPTDQKRRLYDEIAATTFRDPRFIKLNQRLNITEKDLKKAAKAQNMVTFYGAGERTGAMNVENKLAKALNKDSTVLVIRASDRDKVLNEISARMARYEKFDPDLYLQLKALRRDVKDVFNKGIAPGDQIMEELYFLDSKTRDLVEKIGRSYANVVTPEDFKLIAEIMSENLATQVPILKDFTKFFGRLADAYATQAKPKASDLDYTSLLKTLVLGEYKRGGRLPKWLSQILGIKDESVREKLLRRIPGWVPDGGLSQLFLGVKAPTRRRTGFKIGSYSLFSEDITKGYEVGLPNKLDKSWTNFPWVNFDGKVLEQNFTQVFEEKLVYKSAEGEWITNILQVPQRTAPNWWEEFRNKDGKINSIVDINKAKTAFAVNGNHSNDAVIVKQFHLWGKANNTSTSTVHDAFLTNAAKMLEARSALRGIYADTLDANSIKKTLDEMRARGLPDATYKKFLNEAIDIGLIPVVGRSRVGGRLLKAEDILTREDVLRKVEEKFKDNTYWYGIG